MLLPVALVLSLAGCLFALALLRGRRARGRGFVHFHPAWRAFLRERGLYAPRDFLKWSAPLVSGHPDRNVACVELGAGAVAYLKREWRVSRLARLASVLGGHGLSRCVREARALDALERCGAPAPRWLAAGEDGRGRAFLLVAAVPGSVDLPALLARLTGRARNALARRLGAAVAGMHASGFVHGDLYARHVLCRPETGELWFLDWQRSRCGRRLDLSERARDLAALHATLPERLAGPRLRLLALRAYLRGLPAVERPPRHALLAAVEGHSRRLLRRRHVREKRQTEAPAEAQSWVCLDGEALCVTPGLHRRCSQAGLDWLRLEGQPPPRGGPVSRRWLALPDGAPALLVCRTGRGRRALW
jgi:tRNA A-37 threonylcarbamoyl transferase component Bud32